MALPDSVKSLVELTPIEDVVLTLLRDALPEVEFVSMVADDPLFPFVLIRREADWGIWSGDPRFTDYARVTVNVFCDGVDADQESAWLSEAVRVTLRDCVSRVVPGVGHLTDVWMVESPSRTPDWATAAGPVQYADLPTTVVRYESSYEMTVRRAL